MCVCVCVCYRPLVRAVYPNHEVVVFQPRTVIVPDLSSVANIATILALLPHLFQPCSGYSFPPLPGTISYRSPIFHLLTPLLSLFAPASPPPISPGIRSTVHLNGPPPVGLHRLSALPSHDRRPKEFLARECDWLPLSDWPPFSVLNLRPGPCHPQGLSHMRDPLSICLTP